MVSIELKLEKGNFRRYTLNYRNGSSQYYSKQSFCLISTNNKEDIEKELKLMGFIKYNGRIRELQQGILLFRNDLWEELVIYLNKHLPIKDETLPKLGSVNYIPR